jgi:hypothetical protein
VLCCDEARRSEKRASRSFARAESKRESRLRKLYIFGDSRNLIVDEGEIGEG